MYNLVFYDLETTGLLESDPQILEIGAITSNVDNFNVFCLPCKIIDESASVVNGLYLKDDGKLYKKDIKLNAVSEKEGLERLIEWTKQISTTNQIYFIAYNAKFDYTITLSRLEKHGLCFPENVKWKCLQKMVQQKLNSQAYIKFETALKLFEIKFDKSKMHCALVDCEFNEKLFRAINL